jgi:poly(hydroxyalkanoate) depolymerase family esterase
VGLPDRSGGNALFAEVSKACSPQAVATAALIPSGWLEGRLRPADVRAGRRLTRTEYKYSLYIPPGLTRDERVPLLLMLHGCGQNARDFARGSRMNELADAHRFIVLCPEQSRVANPLGCWRWFDRETLDGAGEALLLARLAGQITNLNPVDRTRVYLVGLSAGGAMASILAMRYGAMFAACAIVAGLMYGAADSVEKAFKAMRGEVLSHPQDAALEAVNGSSEHLGFVPALVMHGDRDSAVHPRNAQLLIEQFRKFAELTEAQSGPLVETEERRVVTVGRPYRQRDYRQEGRTVLRQIIIEGLGHAWSGGDDRYRFSGSTGPDASRLIWEFVSIFRRELDGTTSAVRDHGIQRDFA